MTVSMYNYACGRMHSFLAPCVSPTTRACVRQAVLPLLHYRMCVCVCVAILRYLVRAESGYQKCLLNRPCTGRKRISYMIGRWPSKLEKKPLYSFGSSKWPNQPQTQCSTAASN